MADLWHKITKTRGHRVNEPLGTTHDFADSGESERELSPSHPPVVK